MVFLATGVWTLASGETTFPQSVTDLLGREVVFSRAPGRVVSLAPSNTEILFAIGAGDRVVAVTTYCNFPAAAAALPKIGGFAARTISIEAIVALSPDLVVAGDKNQRSVIDALVLAGVPVLSVQPRTVDEVYDTALLLGRLLESEAGASAMIADLRRRLDEVAARIATVPLERRVRVYWEVFDQPLMSAGPRSVVGQVVELGGGINIFGDVGDEYPQINAEAVVARDPQVIMGPASMRIKSMSRDLLAARPGWSRIAAIREGRVVVLPDEPVTRAGPRLVEGVELVARTLYPEIFSEHSGQSDTNGVSHAP